MRAELFRPETPDVVVAIATWEAGRASLEILDDTIAGLGLLLRPTPVVVTQGLPHQLGTSGEIVEQPGSPEWFRAALSARCEALGLRVRFVAEDVRNGWDPAANYRTFEQQEWKLASEPRRP